MLDGIISGFDRYLHYQRIEIVSYLYLRRTVIYIVNKYCFFETFIRKKDI